MLASVTVVTVAMQHKHTPVYKPIIIQAINYCFIIIDNHGSGYILGWPGVSMYKAKTGQNQPTFRPF